MSDSPVPTSRPADAPVGPADAAAPVGPPPVPERVRGPYAPPPGHAPAYAPSWGVSSGPAVAGTPTASGRIERFAAPKRRAPLVLALLAGIAVAAVLGATGLVKLPVPGAPTPSPTAASSPTVTGRGAGFVMPNDTNARGSWEVVEHAWVADGVHVHVRVYGLSGTVQYAFQAFPKGTSKGVQPTEGAARSPELSEGSLTAGEVADGWLFLPLPREESTFFLTTKTGRLLSAQPLNP